jgi:hypothetical protein
MSLFTKTKETQRPYRRRNYFINRRMQGWFTVYFLVLGISISFLSSFVMWYFSSAKLEQYIFRSHIPPVLPWDVLFSDLVISLLVSSGILIIATYVVAHFVFRKIPGQLKDFNEAMDRVGSGDLTTKVPEGGIENLNETLDNYREKMRNKIISLDKIRMEMDNVINDQSAPESKRKDLERLCSTFRLELIELSTKDTGV